MTAIRKKRAIGHTVTFSENKAQEFFSPSFRLRWAIRYIPIDATSQKEEKILQQMWIGNFGTEKWEDIEEVQC
jgi:hypothetical protein